ncbi:MAG TPA: hypothetical protein VL635_15580 [Trinickia sp.]|nr:hypothetical protein [Trinickia sp.]
MNLDWLLAVGPNPRIAITIGLSYLLDITNVCDEVPMRHRLPGRAVQNIKPSLMLRFDRL